MSPKSSELLLRPPADQESTLKSVLQINALLPVYPKQAKGLTSLPPGHPRRDIRASTPSQPLVSLTSTINQEWFKRTQPTLSQRLLTLTQYTSMWWQSLEFFQLICLYLSLSKNNSEDNSFLVWQPYKAQIMKIRYCQLLHQVASKHFHLYSSKKRIIPPFCSPYFVQLQYQ